MVCFCLMFRGLVQECIFWRLRGKGGFCCLKRWLNCKGRKMLIKTRGILFRAIKYSETSIIADIYTEEKGLRGYIISGVRSKHAKVSMGLLQVMSLVELVAYDRDDKSLNRIKEIKAAHVYQSLPFDIHKSAVGMFIVEVAGKAIKGSEENRGLFGFIYDILVYLDVTDALAYNNLHLSFMLGLSAYLGFQPHGEVVGRGWYLDMKEGVFTKDVPEHVYYLSETHTSFVLQLLQRDWQSGGEVKMSRTERRLLVNDLLNYYRLHIDNFPVVNSHEIWGTVL